MIAQERQALMGYAAAALLIVGGAGVWMRWSKQDITLCRSVFRDLAAGRQRAERHIAWTHLNALGMDVASTYAQLPTEKAKAKYRESFVTGFAAGFKQTKGRTRVFENWRVHAREGARTVVAVDDTRTPNTTLYLTLGSASGAKRLERIDSQRPG